MAEIDDRAFEYMQKGDPDQTISGGAIDYSEYEMDMSPEQQEEFMRENTSLFHDLYNNDPLVDKEKLPFGAWLGALNPERIRLLSEDYSDPDSKAPREPHIILAKNIMQQADKHWGGEEGFDKIRNMALGG